MATKIRRCLYIGLGGTGMKSILHTKKMFMDTYGEVPPMIGFLGIDTDGHEYNKSLNSAYGEVRLEPQEQQTIQVQTPRPIFDHNEQSLTWFPKEQNLFALLTMMDGAGQIRSNGRFALWYNANKVATKINQSLSHILNANIINNSKYEILSNTPEIHMVFSICGGTGCGTFINIAYLIREHCQSFRPKLMGYGVLPGVFRTQLPTQTPNVKTNAYGALLDLDYLMNNSGMTKIRVDNMNDTWETTERPFDAFTLVDNRNSHGDTYTDIDQICEMIGLSLVTASGELSAAASSTVDNMSKLTAAGDMDIKSGNGVVKRAWANGMGVSEIIFRGTELYHIYGMKAAQVLATKLLTSGSDANAIANAWIDSPGVNIRENNGQDNVIDFMLSKNPPYPLADIEDTQNPMPEVDMWIKTVAEDHDSVKTYNDKVRELTARVNDEFDKLVRNHINDNGGVRETANIIKAINDQLDIFLGEMTDEKKDLQSRSSQYDSAKKAAANALATYKKPLFGKNHKPELIADLISATMNVAVNKREIVRRTAAITFFNGLKIYLEEYKTKVNNLMELLSDMITSLGNDIAILQNRVGTNVQTFQIDLTPLYANKVTVDSDSLLVHDFVKTIEVNGEKGNILDLLNCSKEQMRRIFLDYTSNGTQAKHWSSLSIDDVIGQLPSDQLEIIVNQAVQKSEPLLSTNYRGYTPRVEPSNYFYIGVYDKDSSILRTGNIVKNLVPTSVSPEFCSIGSKDSIIFYRQMGVVPPFVIADIDSYDAEYSDPRRTINYHYDHIVELKMQRENFSLFPSENDDDSLEIWIKGFIFGVLRNVNGTYQYQDMDDGDPLDDYWTSLNGDTNDRAAAFIDFKGKLVGKLHDQLVKIMTDKHNAMGDEAYEKLVGDVKSADNYRTKYSQINLTNDQLKARGFGDIANQVRAELDFVRKEL